MARGRFDVSTDSGFVNDNSAARLGYSRRTARIKSGIDADLTLLEGDPARDAKAFAHAALTIHLQETLSYPRIAFSTRDPSESKTRTLPRLDRHLEASPVANSVLLTQKSKATQKKVSRARQNLLSHRWLWQHPSDFNCPNHR